MFLLILHIKFYVFILPSAEEEEEAEDSGASDEDVGLDYLTKDIGSVRTTINDVEQFIVVTLGELG